MYQSTVLQVYHLSGMSEALQVNEVGSRVDQMVRARIFWYGHVHEGGNAEFPSAQLEVRAYHCIFTGLTNGLKGRKLIL